MYFLGKPDVLKVKGNPHLVRTNSGYDDERGDYNVVAKDHIAYRWVWGPVGGREGGCYTCVTWWRTCMHIPRSPQVRHTRGG